MIYFIFNFLHPEHPEIFEHALETIIERLRALELDVSRRSLAVPVPTNVQGKRGLIFVFILVMDYELQLLITFIARLRLLSNEGHNQEFKTSQWMEIWSVCYVCKGSGLLQLGQNTIHLL